MKLQELLPQAKFNFRSFSRPSSQVGQLRAVQICRFAFNLPCLLASCVHFFTFSVPVPSKTSETERNRECVQKNKWSWDIFLQFLVERKCRRSEIYHEVEVEKRLLFKTCKEARASNRVAGMAMQRFYSAVGCDKLGRAILVKRRTISAEAFFQGSDNLLQLNEIILHLRLEMIKDFSYVFHGHFQF